MAALICTGITSLDGYVADESGNFDWSVPDEEVHRFVNAIERPIGTYLYGRRLYEVMVAWEKMNTDDQPSFVQDYAQLWRAADKIVFSSTLATASSARTRISREFDPEEIRRLKETAQHDLSIGGPHLAAEAIKAGLVDEYRVLVSPVVVGGGTRFFPDKLRLNLVLVDERRFDNGVVHLRYRTAT